MTIVNYTQADNSKTIALYNDAVSNLGTNVNSLFRISFVSVGPGSRVITSTDSAGFRGYVPGSILSNITLNNDGDSVLLAFDANNNVWQVVSKSFPLGSGGGGGGGTYVHSQDTPLAVWTINHNLGSYPSVTTVDSGGDMVFGGSILYVNNATVVITFSAAFSGKAYLN
jgi:hypothetical protein